MSGVLNNSRVTSAGLRWHKSTFICLMARWCGLLPLTDGAIYDQSEVQWVEAGGGGGCVVALGAEGASWTAVIYTSAMFDLVESGKH